MQQFGLQVRYMADDEFSLRVRMIGALAFVPPNDVIDSFDNLAQDIRNEYGQDMDDILDYFEDNCVGRFRHNAPRRRPIFDIEMWNMFHRTDAELPRTNNAVEGWHRGFQAHVTVSHPSFWKFIDISKREEGIVRAAVLQNQGVHPPAAQRRRYANNYARILRIVDDYPNRIRFDCLRSIAHNVAF